MLTGLIVPVACTTWEMSPWSTFAVKYCAVLRDANRDVARPKAISATGGATSKARCIIDRCQRLLKNFDEPRHFLEVSPGHKRRRLAPSRALRSLPAAGGAPRPSGAAVLQTWAAAPASAPARICSRPCWRTCSYSGSSFSCRLGVVGARVAQDGLNLALLVRRQVQVAREHGHRVRGPCARSRLRPRGEHARRHQVGAHAAQRNAQHEEHENEQEWPCDCLD